MSLQEPLRLRISVQRHGVPEVKLVWPCVRSQDLTVSKLLAQINEVIPLETGEWGLEDYVLELADGFGCSYECLHFQEVPKILKNDDQVTIRYLEGEDLKRRRLSGRHQITVDGKHLVDGLVFGRPWLRTPRDRPALDLPPRKRVRTSLEYEDDDEGQQRLLTQGPAHDDDDSFCELGQEQDGGESSGDDIHDTEGNQEDLASELRFLLQENKEPSNRDTTSHDVNANTSGLDLGSLDNIVALRAAFPLTPVTAIEAELLKHQKDIRKTYESLKKSNDSTLSFDELMDRYVAGLFGGNALHATGESASGSLLPESRVARPLIEEVNDGGSEGAPQADSSSDSDTDEEISSTSDDDEDTSDSDDSDDSSTGSSDGDDDSEGSAAAAGEGAAPNNEEAGRGNHSPDKSSSDSSRSSSNSCSGEGAPINEDNTSGLNPTRAEPDSDDDVASASEPTSGLLTRTQKRNIRRRKKLMQKKKDVLALKLEERKQALLRAMGQDTEEDPTLHPPQQGCGTETAHNGVASEAASIKRQCRIDVGAGRRLVFGALGLKAPKTKVDEENIKQALMKDVRPLTNPRLAQSDSGGEQQVDASWRQKLNYGAVECVHENVSLSEPPFPFKQRWDPQQQRRKGKKRKRGVDEDFYGDGDSGLFLNEEDASALQDDSVIVDDEAAIDDMPALPADLSSLPALKAESLQQNMIITWKQMVMSQATRWQPQIAQKTGIVLLAGSTGNELHVRLAVRDREPRRRLYDGKTGERIYDKFEVPDSDSEGDQDGEDDGERVLSWTELMDPRILSSEGLGETTGEKSFVGVCEPALSYDVSGPDGG
ncbi:transcription factor atf21 [Ophiocordyceps camponoti-floridani]|uniref:Transcription factor atf21 n=1 Tax=Ophiocordyceps camponoti-floridani TaxID=2030778 RepID=A0A8H4VB83_9HYPO|nr:transcription factor atf21 [Ophiocordyceps camponoti-floridani]